MTARSSGIAVFCKSIQFQNGPHKKKRHQNKRVNRSKKKKLKKFKTKRQIAMVKVGVD